MLEGKTALIIGATADIGEAIVRRFVSEKIEKLILHGRNKERLTQLSQGLEGIKVEIIPAELCNDSSCQNLKAKLRELPKIDIFVYTPGTCGEMDPVGFIRFKDFTNVIHINLTACFELFETCIPCMQAGSAAVFITSTNSRDALACGAAYCTTKCALKRYMQEKALCLGPRGIRVNTVAPGLVGTKFHKPYFEKEEEMEEFFEGNVTGHALKRIATVDGVANAVAFLCSDLSLDITGTEMVVDCGGSLVPPHGDDSGEEEEEEESVSDL